MRKNDARRGAGWAVAVMVALAVGLPGCGGDNSSDNDPEVFTDTRTVAVLDASFVAFTAQRNGSVDANVNWNNASNDIDIYVTAGNCATLDSLLQGLCNVIAFSESLSAKPEVLTFAASNGTNYRVWALNLGPGTETVTIRLTAR